MSKASKLSTIADMLEAGIIDQEEALDIFLGCADYTVDDWLKAGPEISERQLERYPNAKKAQKIKGSKLYKVMK